MIQESRGFEYYIIEDRPTNYGGQQQVYKFPNGFGASVVNGAILHSFPFYVEVAVIIFDGDGWSITYDTSITDDVEVLADHVELINLLSEIYKLECSHESHFISSMTRCEKCDKKEVKKDGN